MTNYKATLEQWYMLEQYAKSNCAVSPLILELRARVAELEKKQTGVTNYGQFLVDVIEKRLEKLEAQANHFVDVPKMVPPPVATDEELWNIWANRPNRPLSAPAALRAVYNLGIEHGQAGSREVAKPAPVVVGLVEQALEQLGSIQIDLNKFGMGISTDTIRRALEALPE
jgi:hypothetical protein